MGKVSAGLVRDLVKEVDFQIVRLKREIRIKGASDGRLHSLHCMRTIKKLLSMLLCDGEIVLAGAFASDNDNEQTGDEREGFMMKLAKFFRMVSPDEVD